MTADATELASPSTAVVAGLEFSRAGSPGGFPVVLHHGLLGGAQIDGEASALAADIGIDLIAVARPGYGRSTPVQMDSIAQWPELLAPLLDALGVEKYGAWGISAGAPYSYALSAHDHHRVISVAVTSGLGHAKRFCNNTLGDSPSPTSSRQSGCGMPRMIRWCRTRPRRRCGQQ